jgi:UDP-N-acetylglucosamine acyltransferase
MNIHPTSIISKEAKIDPTAVIGPYCIVRGDVTIGKNSVLENHVIIGSDDGEVVIGNNNRIYAGAAVGGAPQDKKYKGEKTKLVIGDSNHIREYVTLSIGTITGGGVTTIGNGNLIMAYTHFGHDCKVGDNNVIANSCQFAGHVEIENNVTVGGICAINQFVKLGSFSFIGGFSFAQGNYAVVRATNKIGLERNGFSEQEINDINKAIRIMTKSEATIEEKIQRIKEECQPGARIEKFVEFIRTSKRGVAI